MEGQVKTETWPCTSVSSFCLSKLWSYSFYCLIVCFSSSTNTFWNFLLFHTSVTLAWKVLQGRSVSCKNLNVEEARRLMICFFVMKSGAAGGAGHQELSRGRRLLVLRSLLIERCTMLVPEWERSHKEFQHYKLCYSWDSWFLRLLEMINFCLYFLTDWILA